MCRSGDGWASAHQVFRPAPWPDRAPTTVALSPYGTYVLSGRLGILLGGGITDTLTCAGSNGARAARHSPGGGRPAAGQPSFSSRSFRCW